MRIRTRPAFAPRRRWRGQALVEVGLSIVLFFAVALGVMTFGHAFMVVNMITHAARDGARLAATCNNDTPCTGGQSGPNRAACFGSGNAKLVDDRG